MGFRMGKKMKGRPFPAGPPATAKREKEAEAVAEEDGLEAWIGTELNRLHVQKAILAMLL